MKDNIDVFENTFVIHVEQHNGGKVLLCNKKGELESIVAKTVIIATGGIAGIFKTTTNVITAVGTGHFLALKLGIPLIDIDLIQLFPYYTINPIKGGSYKS